MTGSAEFFQYWHYFFVHPLYVKALIWIDVEILCFLVLLRIGTGEAVHFTKDSLDSVIVQCWDVDAYFTNSFWVSVLWLWSTVGLFAFFSVSVICIDCWLLSQCFSQLSILLPGSCGRWCDADFKPKLEDIMVVPFQICTICIGWVQVYYFVEHLWALSFCMFWYNFYML